MLKLTPVFRKRNFIDYQMQKTWLLIIVAIICLVLLFVGGPQGYAQRSHEYVWGLGHILCFGVWTTLLIRWRSGWSFRRQVVAVVTLTLVLGIGIEILQAGFGRYFDLVDVWNNLIGSLLALAFSGAARRGLTRLALILLRVVALLFLVAGLLPLGRVLLDERLAMKQFPLLSDFETVVELGRWEGNAHLSISQDVVSHGASSLKMELTSERYSGLFLKFFPEDWRRFKRLTFDMFNPSDSVLKLTCRVHDHMHGASGNSYADRFNRVIALTPGWTRVDLSLEQITNGPVDRQLDLGRVAGLGLYATDLAAPETLYLDYVRLSR